MGHTIDATCTCGFDARDLMIGGGMRDHTTNCSYPAICKGCHDIVTVNLLDAAPSCSECEGTEVTAYNRPELLMTLGRPVSNWGDLTLTDGKYLCPKCGSFELSFRGGGVMFD